MPRGAKPGERRGGRKKGARNKKTARLIAEIEQSGQTPLEYLLEVMRSPVPTELAKKIEGKNLDVETIVALIGWHKVRLEAAKDAAPYVHPRLMSIHQTDSNKKKSFAEWADEIQST